jgi:GDPmannose 4,6-dehydratase
MTRAIVVGGAGQDGRLLLEALAREGATAVGLDLGAAVAVGAPGFAPAPVDVTDAAAVADLVLRFAPTEVYYLAAHHHSSEEGIDADVAGLLRRSLDVHVTGLGVFLDALRAHAPTCRLFYAASSLVFGTPPTPTQDESTPLEPRCVYGITKTAGLFACRTWRERHGVFASVGILYNHESPYRAAKFVSRRIVQGARDALAAKQTGRASRLVLGNLAAAVDWGWAPDTVDAMRRILALPDPGDFVVATGEPHTVRDFAAAAFAALGLDWRDTVVEDPALLHRHTGTLVGDASKLRRLTGWKPSLTFAEMVARLVRESG